ncbi:MAG: 30S ribosomal protein S3 [Clostridia bacterium]|nr:30S ribosomal protein S3 [Clostridia bacterium]
MGQKVNPHGARVGVIIDWSTKWYAGKKDFSNNLIEDYNLRKMLKEKLNQAGISHIDLQRAGEKLHVIVYTAKPGIVIGKGGAGVEALKKEVEEFTGKQVQLDIIEIKNPDIDAQLVAENIAQQLEKRVSFRRAMKQTIGRAMKSGAKGIKTTVSGRLGGADIARSEGYHEGSIPLQTLRAHIDYGFAEAKTTYGRIGVKVWIYKGQVLPTKDNKGSKLVNAMSESTLNGTGNRREGRRRFDRNNNRGERGERAPRNNDRTEAKEGGK